MACSGRSKMIHTYTRKFRREMIRLFTQITSSLTFAEKINERAKTMWNNLQYEEGKLQIPPPKYQEVYGDITMLDLSQTSGFGETVHPDVLYIQNGFGAGNWQYLMTITPFPRAIVYFENPEFLVSHDGIEWNIPQGGRSPLIPAPSNWLGYNSDPSLLYDSGKLYLTYREVRAEKKFTSITIYTVSTYDGITWSSPQTLLTKKAAAKSEGFLMSQTLLKKDDKYIMWYVDRDDTGVSVIKRDGDNILNIENPRVTHIEGMTEGETPWHIDVVEDEEDRLLMSICAKAKNKADHYSILFAESGDIGESWRIIGNPIEPGEYPFCEKSLYRASLVKGPKGTRILYYSGRDAGGHWFTALRNVSPTAMIRA